MTKKGAKVKEETVDIRFLDILELLPNPYQPESRVVVAPEIAKKFALSIWEHGLIQTPVARVSNGRYEIADGWLRRAGFQFNLQEFNLQEYAKMPCVIRELTDQQMADMVMEANTVRKDLNPIELAHFYKRYLEDFKMPQAELARRHNCSQGEIANTIRLLELPGDIQEKVISQEISETHGRQLLRLNYNPELQQKVVKQTIENGYSVDRLSNTIADQIYWDSKNLDPDEHPKPPFDIKECEGCLSRQKIGDPGSPKRKTWRCLNQACYKKKKDQAEAERAAKLAAEIAAVNAEAKSNSKGKGKKEVAIIDCSKLNWRDYQDLTSNFHKIDNPEQCKICPNRAVGKFFNGRTGPVCVNVKCFKEKERAYEAKKAAKDREAEHQLTKQVKTICDKVEDEVILFQVISEYLLAHSRKDTRERFAKMYGMANAADCFSDKVNVLSKIAALVVQIERYEGTKGSFMKMMAELSGKGDEINKQIAAFQEKYCKTCEHGKGICNLLMRVYPEGKCYAYYKKKKEASDETKDNDSEQQVGKSEDEILRDSLPCKNCANAPTCDRTFFYVDDKGGYACDNKVSAGTREEVTDAV